MSPTGGDSMDASAPEIQTEATKSVEMPKRKQVGRRTAKKKDVESKYSRKQTGIRTDPSKRRPSFSEPLSPSAAETKNSVVQVMNVTSQSRVGIAVRMMLMRLDIEDGLSLPLKGVKEEDFDDQKFLHPRGYDVDDIIQDYEEIAEEKGVEDNSNDPTNDLIEVDPSELVEVVKDVTTKVELNQVEVEDDLDLDVPIHVSPDKQIKSSPLQPGIDSESQDDLTEEEVQNLIEKTNKKLNEISLKNTRSIFGGQCDADLEVWIREKLSQTSQAVENDVENSRTLYDALEDLIENHNNVVKVTLSQNGSGVKLKLRNEMELTGHPQKGSTNWFLLPFINRYLYFNLFAPKKLFTNLHDDLEPNPALIRHPSSAGQISNLKSNTNPKKMRSIDFIRQKHREGFVKDYLSSQENGTRFLSHELDPTIEELRTALSTAEYAFCAVNSCYLPLHRDDFFNHVKTSHSDVEALSQFIFYNEDLQLVGLDYFQSCGACVVCEFLFLSNGLIPWERINSHYEKEHPTYCSKPPEQKIKSFDVSATIKGIKRGRGRPPVKSSSTLTPPVGAIHVGDNIFMVRTGSGPTGQPSYTPMNLTPQKKGSSGVKRSLEDPESPSKKRKYTKAGQNNDLKVLSSTPRFSGRLKRKSLKASKPHFLNELDKEWEESIEESLEDVDSVPGEATEDQDLASSKNLVVNGDMNKTFIRDLVYFFNLYLGSETCKKVMKSMEGKRQPNSPGVYKTRKVQFRTNARPQKNKNGEIENQHYCCKITLPELESILEQELGPIFSCQNLVAQQYSFVDNMKCCEKVRVFQFEENPEIVVSAQTYVFTADGTAHDLINLSFSNKSLVEETDEDKNMPWLKSTRNENMFVREMKIISNSLSTISCRESKPRFDERGLIMTQKYCCNKTLAEVMSDWWQGFIEMAQMKEVPFNTDKLQLKRKIPINGKEALPQKKLYKAIFDTGASIVQSLEVDFTYFQTAEGSLNLTFICIQWIKKNAKVESDLIDMPSMIDFDSLTVYHRRNTADYSTARKSYYKSSEISFQESVKVLVNSNCVPRNQAMFTSQTKGRVVAELRSYLGMFHPTKEKPAELFIGGYKYLGHGCHYRRGFQEIDYDLVVMVTYYKFDKSYTDSSCPEDMPQSFSHVEINWVNKPVKGIGSSQMNARMVDDSYVPYYPKPTSIRRNYRYKTDPEMFALNEKIGTRAIANRLKILNKNKSSATRPGMQTINNLYNRKPKDPQEVIVQDEVSAAIQAIPGGPPGPAKRGRKKGVKNKKSLDDDEEAELKCFKEQLLSFDSLIRFPKSVTYNKKQENGMVMVKSCKKLLYSLIGSTTPVHANWSPIHLEVETYEPSLTNAHMVLTCFSVPSVIHRQRKTPKVCLGPVCLSASKSDEDATILGEHLRYNNENVTSMRSMAAMNDELYHSLRTGLKAYSSVYLYDESSVLNSATNRAKCQKHALKLSEVALSNEIGAITVSWEVYMDKIIGMKHESDMVDLLLSLEEGEEYVLIDEEGKRYFQLTELEKSQLDEDELRFYEIEFFEWLGSGKFPEITWRDYVMMKVGNNPANPNEGFQTKVVNENDYESWNSDQSYDNQFFGNIILQKGTLPKQQYHKVGKKKRLANKAGIRTVPTTTMAGTKVHEVEENVNVYSETYTTIEESPAVFSAFDRVVVDGTFMLQ